LYVDRRGIAGRSADMLLKGVTYVGKRGIIVETAQIGDKLEVINNQ
jgi:hypothetical protein